jgi:hypothetical protein
MGVFLAVFLLPGDDARMAEEAGTAVADAPSEATSTESAPAPAPVESPTPPSGVDRTIPTPEPTPHPWQDPPRQEPRPEPAPRQPEPAPRPSDPEPAREPAPLEEAKDASDSLLNWRDLADPEYRKDPVLMKYKSPGEALKALVHQERLLGNSIQIPREGAGETQWRTIFEKLGCPKAPSDYTIADPDMGKDEQGNARGLAPNFLVNLLDVAHRAGLNNKQAQEFVNFAARTVVQSENIQAGEMAMQKAQAERELFDAFAGETAAMIQKATMAISRMGEGRYGGGQYAQRAAEKIRASHLGNDVDVIAMFANVWDNFSEGQFIESGASGILSSREQIDADIAAFGAVMNDPTKSMPEREAARSRQFKLFQDRNALDEAAARRQSGFR